MLDNNSFNIDPYSGAKFLPKRSNQIFSCPENKIKFNNAKAEKLRKERAPIDKKLHGCHLLLKKLYAMNKTKEYSKDFLLGAGLDFSAYNHIVIIDSVKNPAYYQFALCQNDLSKKYKIILNEII
jgi:hypothetical protein